MTGPRRTVGQGRLRWVPVGLAAVAEASWIAVLGGLIDGIAHRGPSLGLGPLVPIVLGGIVLARYGMPRLRGRWPVTGLALASAASVAGVLAAPAVRVALGAAVSGVDPAAAALDPGGVVAGLAVLRGFAHAGLPLDGRRLDRLLVGGIVTIALAALVGGLLPAPFRDPFLAEATSDGLVFAATAVLALSLARLTAAGTGTGADWPRNPVWLATVVTVIALILLAAIPIARVVGPIVEIVAGVALGPILIVGLVAGWSRRTALLIVRVLLVGGVVILLIAALSGHGVTTPLPQGAQGDATSAPSGSADPLVLLGLGALAALGGVAVLLLIRAWMGSIPSDKGAELDTRSIDRGPVAGAAARPRTLLSFRRAPRDAVAAYRALLHDLDRIPGIRRDAAESPQEHARRLRTQGGGNLGLDLLAADYALARFGSVALSSAEDRRGVRRWRRLRRELRPAPRSAAEGGPPLEQPLRIEALDPDDLPTLGRAPDDREA